MGCRHSFAVSLAAGLLLAAGTAIVQAAPPLRSTVADDADAPLPPTLEIQPIEAEELPPPRRRPELDPYAPIGIGAGGLRLYPSLNTSAVVTSNVNEDSKKEAALGVRLRPSLRFESDWVRHSWTGAASGDFVRYPDHREGDSSDANAFTTLRVDVRRSTQAEFDLGYVFSQSGREESEVPLSAVGFRNEHTGLASAALIHDFGLIQTRFEAGETIKVYDDVKLKGGGTEDNSDRNYSQPRLAFRATYSDPPAIKPFVEVAYEPRLYVQKRDRNGIENSSDGIAVNIGATIDDSPIWSGEMALTYLHRNYKDPSLKSNDMFGFDGLLTWNPTELTKIVLSAGSDLEDDVGAATSSTRNWRGHVDVTHGIRDNIDLLAGAGVEVETGGASTDVTYDGLVGMEWKVSPGLAWTASYDFTWLDASEKGRGYTEHRISAGLALSR